MADQPQQILVGESSWDDKLDAIVDDMIDEPDTPEVEVADVDETEDVETAPEEDNADDEADFIELKHNGRPVKMKLDEVLEHAQKGFDYTQKTQELAEQRRQAEHYFQQAQQNIQLQQQTIEESAKLHSVDSQVKQYEQVNWDAWMDQDPVEASKGWQKYSMLKSQRDDLANTIQQKQTQVQQMSRQQLQQKIAEGAQQLASEIKGWGPELASALKTNGMEYGFSADELDTVIDPRMVKVLHDAYQWRQLQAKKPEVQKRVTQAPQSVKPNGKTESKEANRNALLKQLKSGRSEKARRAIADSLLDKFV
jgi:hypothetical protein